MESEGKKRLIRISVWVAVASLVLAVVSSLATALSADAHAALKAMSPAAGSTVTKAPSAVVLTFNETISTSFATVTVTDQDGQSTAAGRPVVSGKTVTQKLGAIGSGPVTVAFRVVSADGHPIAGRATFTVRLPAATTTPSTPVSASPRTTAPGSTPAASENADDSPGARTDVDGPAGSRALWWTLGVGVLVIAGAGAVALVRRRSGRE